MVEKVFLNDKLVEVSRAKVSVTDAGLLYGMGLFETMRSYNCVVFALSEHLDRLFASAKALSVNMAYDKKSISQAVYRTLEANKLSDARIRLTLTSGPMSAPDDKPQPTLLITAAQFKPYPANYYQKGVMVVLSPYKQNPAEPLYGHKTISYLSRMLALELAHKSRAAEALWFTTDNRLAEGCISNVFVVKDSALYTPSIKTPVLPGIARKTVLKIAAENSIRADEKDLNINELLDADEVFITNVIMQVIPVVKIEKHDVGTGAIGPVTRELQRLFVKYVETACGQKNEGKKG